MGSRRAAHRTSVAGTEPAPGPGAEGDETSLPRGGTAPAGAPGTPPVSRRKAKKVADAERRERHRLAEERLAAERARHRADNRAARERDAAMRAERQRAAESARERAQSQEAERPRRANAPAPGGRSTPVGAGDEAARAAERERKRRAAAARRAERVARDRRRAERKAERDRAREAARRAEREAVQARARGANPYAILGVTPDATGEEVDRAYRRLARSHHPDLHRDGTPQERAACEGQMKRINAAYSILGDVERRAAFDHLRRKA